MIAATAIEHDLALVTRNVKAFAGLGVTIFNPWETQALAPPEMNPNCLPSGRVLMIVAMRLPFFSREPSHHIKLSDRERMIVVNALECLSHHFGGAHLVSEKMPPEFPKAEDILVRVQSKTVEPTDLKLIINALGLYRWTLKHHHMGTFQGMPNEERFQAEAAEMEHVALGDLCVRLCDEAADRRIVVPDLSSKIGFF